MLSLLSKSKKLQIIVATFVLLLIPFPTPMVPEWKMVVMDREGNHLANIQVEESWKHYTYFFAEGYELRHSDENGIVTFPSRWLWASALSRMISPPLAELGKLAHGSAGLSIDARVWDPEKRYFSGSDNMIFWYSDRDAGKPLPEKIVATKSDD